MTTFIFIAAVMAAIAATAVAFPLLRSSHSRLVGALAGVVVMAAAAGLYPLWSNWNWHAATASKPAVSTQVLEMVAKLERHMKDAPDDLTGWILLGRSYLALERTDDAIEAYGHAHRLDPNNAEALLGLGEAWSPRIPRRSCTRASVPRRAATAPQRGNAGSSSRACIHRRKSMPC
jgi:cytochrome c-type biogenesis protein CcmH